MTSSEINNLKKELKEAVDRGNKAIECADKTHNMIMEKIEDVKNEMVSIKVELASLPEKLAEKFDQRYASKNAERVIYGIVGAMCLAVLGGLMALVIK